MREEGDKLKSAFTYSTRHGRHFGPLGGHFAPTGCFTEQGDAGTSIIGLPNPSAAFCDHIIWLGPGLRQSVRLVWAPRPCEDKVCLQMIIFAHMKTVILYYYSSCT